MILTAVVSLNERGGSSSRAISKFIKSKYTNLSKKHDALLLCHLRRLRTKGALHMLRHSYKLSPRSKINLAPTLVTSRPRGRPKKVPETSQLSSVLSDKLVVKRGPGRPPKALTVKRGPGRPPNIINVKRGPGRPPKILSDERGARRPSQKLAVKRGPGRPPNILAMKKGPGRPPKSMAVKKGPGRPPKSLAVKKGPGRPPKSLAVKKGPGRPPKNPGVVTSIVTPSGASKRGRPPKSEKKGPGRPRKEPGVPVQSGEKRKGPGRPRKVENGAPPDSSGEKRGPGRPKKVKEAPLETSEKKAPCLPTKEGNDVALQQIASEEKGLTEAQSVGEFN